MFGAGAHFNNFAIKPKSVVIIVVVVIMNNLSETVQEKRQCL